MVGRLVLTLALCAIVGFERSAHDRASGLRPHILVGLGACLMTLAGGYGFADVEGATRDPMRIASYVVSGIGFLGAGAILRHGATVRGLTTAASLWGAAGIGLTVGVGLGALAAVTVGLLVFTLSPLQRIEARMRRGGSSRLIVHLADDAQSIGKTLDALDRLGIPVRRATIDPGEGEGSVLQVELSRAVVPSEEEPLVKRLLTLKHVLRVESFGTDRSRSPTVDDEGTAEFEPVASIDVGAAVPDIPTGGDRDSGEAPRRKKGLTDARK
ncbi:MAG: MgtC/SapB family protein [Chloroflexota bacterium]|nr:MAG: MgtC/SapB family protein [Chloroflexota bacterium]